MRRVRRHGGLGPIWAGAFTGALLAGCASTGPSFDAGRLEVVAAENVWGSIAAQLGGDRVSVRSLVTNPNTDPHAYEPTPSDARAVATARYVIYNGIGYDPWVARLLRANPTRGRVVVNIGDLVGVRPGGNPHRWYSPPDVRSVTDRITADYRRLAPADASYFDQQRTAFVSSALNRYTSLIAAIGARYAGTAVGASENIVSPLADALRLQLLTPPSFLAAISEGGDPTAADKALCDTQIKTHRIKVYVYNRQNSTPDVARQVDEAKAAGVPVVSFTETLTPPDATFEDWQAAQLEALAAALARATGR